MASLSPPHYKVPWSRPGEFGEIEIEIRRSKKAKRRRIADQPVSGGAGDVVVVELGGAGGAVPGHRLDRLRGLVLQLLPAGRPQLQAQECRGFEL